MTASTVSFSEEDSKAFTYVKPAFGYGFIAAPQLNAPAAFSITDNGNGTGTLKLSAPLTGSVDIWTVDKP